MKGHQQKVSRKEGQEVPQQTLTSLPFVPLHGRYLGHRLLYNSTTVVLWKLYAIHINSTDKGLNHSSSESWQNTCDPPRAQEDGRFPRSCFKAISRSPLSLSSPLGDCKEAVFHCLPPAEIFFFFCFLEPHLQHMEVPRLGPTPQPQQHKIQAESATYTTAHGNTRSLTH